MGVPYGYYLAPNGHVAIDQVKANIVRMIYQQYLSGMRLGGIADFLFKRAIPSPHRQGTLDTASSQQSAFQSEVHRLHRQL